MAEYVGFRQRLDAVLRTRDVQRVSAFLIAEEQWEPGVPADPQFAMWMMIAGAPTLKDLHAEARTWLTAHGHAEEAEAILSRAQSGPGGNKPSGRSRGESSVGKQTGQNRSRAQGGSNMSKSPGQSRNRSQSGASVSKKRQP